MANRTSKKPAGYTKKLLGYRSRSRSTSSESDGDDNQAALPKKAVNKKAINKKHVNKKAAPNTKKKNAKLSSTQTLTDEDQETDEPMDTCSPEQAPSPRLGYAYSRRRRSPSKPPTGTSPSTPPSSPSPAPDAPLLPPKQSTECLKCIELQKEVDGLKRELEEAVDVKNPPRSGRVLPWRAKHFNMIELGAGYYTHKQVLRKADMKKNAKTRACYLLSAFMTPDELAELRSLRDVQEGLVDSIVDYARKGDQQYSTAMVKQALRRQIKGKTSG